MERDLNLPGTGQDLVIHGQGGDYFGRVDRLEIYLSEGFQS